MPVPLTVPVPVPSLRAVRIGGEPENVAVTADGHAFVRTVQVQVPEQPAARPPG